MRLHANHQPGPSRGTSTSSSLSAVAAAHAPQPAVRGECAPPAPPPGANIRTTSRMDFSSLFNDTFLSDFQLQFMTAEGAELGLYHVHGVVLAGQSPYFKARLQNWTGQVRVRWGRWL